MILENNNINPDLLYRYFIKSNKYNRLIVYKEGMKIIYIKTIYGVISLKGS